MNHPDSPGQTPSSAGASAPYERFVEGSTHAIWCLEAAAPISWETPVDDMASVLRTAARFTVANDAFSKRMGATVVSGLPPTALDSFWLARETAPLEALREDHAGTQEITIREFDTAGRIRHLSCELQAIEEEGALKAIWAIERDVTGRVEREDMLRQSQEFYKAISETALDGICVLNGDLALMDCNDAFAQLVGSSRELLVKDGDIRLQPVVGIKDEPTPFSIIARQGRWRGEALLQRTSPSRHASADHEEPLRVELACRTTESGAGRRFYCFVRDLSERRSAEKREIEHQKALAHVARLSTLGEMTSGIAHELNQPLAAIVNYANGCTRIMTAQGIRDPMITKGLHAIAEQGRRAADIIARMRKFSRRDDDKREPFLIDDVLSEAIELSMTELHKNGIRIETDFAPIQDTVLIDGIQIEQVALNLIRNAIEALAAQRAAPPTARDDEPATLEASGSSRLQPQISVRTSATPPEEARGPSLVTVTIQDTGPGIPDSLSARLFDPFFSSGRQGIGLGLTISRSIIESHGGRLWYSPGEVGASFHFSLPLRTAPIPE